VASTNCSGYRARLYRVESSQINLILLSHRGESLRELERAPKVYSKRDRESTLQKIGRSHIRATWKMYSFILIPLIFSLNISVIQASCNKTLRLGETNETILVPSVTYKYESRINQRQHKPHQSSRSEDREREFVDQSNELDNLRLEYNKYKILSYLGITTDPDSIMPSLNRDSRLELISSSEFANSAKEVNGASVSG